MTPSRRRRAHAPLAVLFDLVVVLPLLFSAVILRPARRSLLDAAPVLALGALAAGVLLATRTDVRIPLRVAGAAAELAVLAIFARRVRKATAELRGAAKDDLLLRVGALTDPVLRVAGAEFLVLYYALVGPFIRRPPRHGEFSYTEESSLGGVLLEAATPIPQHCDVTFAMAVPEHHNIGAVQLAGEGEVVRVEAHQSGTGFAIAVKCRRPLSKLEDYLPTSVN